MRLRRIVWKRPPTLAEIISMQMATLFGPSCFERGNEWLFMRGDDPMCHAETPAGYTRIN